jgi:signal transduction histidine kinase/DNA-binding response OmpR family regulator
MVALGVGFAFLSDMIPNRLSEYKVALFAIVFYILSVLAWQLEVWQPWLGRWFISIALIVAVYLGNSWLGVPGFMFLMTIPVALTAALLNLSAATITTVGITAFLLFLSKSGAASVDPDIVPTVLIAIWSTLGVMFAVYQPMYQITQWSLEHYQRAQSLLEETRDRKAELEQTLADLALANRELALLNERIATLRLVAEEAQKAKAVFVAKVSHEFRTPLNMIIGLVDLLAETPEVYSYELPFSLLEDLQIVRRNCEHLSSMINDVLDLSQAESGQLTLHREWIDLAESINSALMVVHPLLEKKKLSLQVSIPNNLPQIYCDRTRIRQVILNLVSNAARFTEEGGITLHVEQQDQEVVVSVTDTGPGISSENMEKVFQPFYQETANRRWHDQGGSGLGLSISKQFIELHNGRIWLESEPGAGSTFYFRLPVSPLIASTTGPENLVSEDWVWLERTSWPKVPTLPYKERIIICDETSHLYSLLTHNFGEIEFVDTKNLSQTIQELQNCPAHAVILNTASPHKLGPLVEQARREIHDTPIVGCTLPPQVNYALDVGAVDYLVKPVTRAELEAAIQKVDIPVKHVLVVDDNLDIRQLFVRMLSLYDETLEISTASSGEEALAELQNRPPDLILLDIMLPDIDGWQILEFKGNDETIKNIPVIIVSTQSQAEQPATSDVLLTTIGQGLSVNTLLRCSLQFSRLLLTPDSAPGLVPG